MSFEGFLRDNGGLSRINARISFQDRWMIFSGVNDLWVVYQRKNGTQKTKVLFAGDSRKALEVLGNGMVDKKPNGVIP